MSRTFDTGLQVANRTVIRNAITELLKPLLFSEGGFLRAIVKLGGTLRNFAGNEDSVAQLFASLLGRAPAIAIAVGDRVARPAGVGGYREMSTCIVHVYFLCNHARSLLARVEADVVSVGTQVLDGDDTKDPGIDVAMQCAEELLIGQRLDKTSVGAVVKHLEMQREEELLVTNQHTVWMQTYEVGVTRTINQSRNVVQRLLGIDAIVRPAPVAADSPSAIAFSTELHQEPPP